MSEKGYSRTWNVRGPGYRRLMPEFWHVHIQRLATGHDVWAIDQTRAWIDERVLAPRAEGRTSMIDGKTVDWTTVDELQIGVTDAPAEQAGLAAARAESRGIISAGHEEWAFITRHAKNVTDDLVTEPVGSRTSTETQAAGIAPDPRKVMVVCGRNQPAVRDLFAYLHAIDLRPGEWSSLVAATGSGAPYIGQVLDTAFATATAVVVLSTPDDVAMMRPEYRGPKEPDFETSPTSQARPNVIFEAGLAFGRHPDRTILLELGDLRPLSDLDGRHAIRLNGTPAPLHELARRLQTAGCAVELDTSPWSYPERYSHLDPANLPVSADETVGSAFRQQVAAALEAEQIPEKRTKLETFGKATLEISAQTLGRIVLKAGGLG